MTKKINEENVVSALKKVKRVPSKPTPLWTQGLTVGKLKELIKDLNDDTAVLVKSSDFIYEHTFNLTDAKVSTAMFSKKEICEDYGDLTPESEFGKRKEVVIIY